MGRVSTGSRSSEHVLIDIKGKCIHTYIRISVELKQPLPESSVCIYISLLCISRTTVQCTPVRPSFYAYHCLSAPTKLFSSKVDRFGFSGTYRHSLRQLVHDRERHQVDSRNLAMPNEACRFSTDGVLVHVKGTTSPSRVSILFSLMITLSPLIAM